jgi:hypothetical protein
MMMLIQKQIFKHWLKKKKKKKQRKSERNKKYATNTHSTDPEPVFSKYKGENAPFFTALAWREVR